ncbi:MAG: hypothetical protein R3313_04935, partial [Candidatus Saccharimonadales bacterium]|nr:hypothetical protein [Candidatus Saccharimonadales bacterium]
WMAQSDSNSTDTTTQPTTTDEDTNQTGQFQPRGSQSYTFTIRNKTYLYNALQRSIDVIVEYPEEYSADVERVRVSEVDPASKKVIFTHSKESDGALNKFSYYKTKLALYDIESGSTTEIIDTAEDAVTHLNWSPDGAHFTAIINDGARAQIRTATGELLAEIEGGNLQEVVWIDAQTISYIQGETLYRGTLENQKAEVIAEDALKNLGSFEGPGRMRVPFWNGDWVVYESTTGNLVALNTSDNETTNLGTLSTEPCFDFDCGEGTEDAYPFEWLNESRFLFGVRPDGGSGGAIFKTFSTSDRSISTTLDSEDFIEVTPVKGESLLLRELSDVAPILNPDNSAAKYVAGIDVSSVNDEGRLDSVCQYDSEFASQDPENIGYTGGDTPAPGFNNSIFFASGAVAILEVDKYAQNSAFLDSIDEATSIEVVDLSDCTLITRIEIPS